MNIVESVGYLASALVILSFMMKDMKQLRILNAFGCACFVAYGVLLKTSYPIIITNCFILLTHTWFFIKNSRYPTKSN